MTSLCECGYTGAGAQNEARRPLRVGEKAPQALESRRACYGQPFSGLRERAQKMAAVALSSGEDKKTTPSV